MQDTAAILTHGLFSTSSAKTAHGLVRGPSRFRIVAVIDEKVAGRDAGELLDARHRGIPTVTSLDALLESGTVPSWLVVGIATPGGVMPDDLRPALGSALERGIGVVSGLHEFVGDDPNLVAAAARGGGAIVDIRRPRSNRDLHFWSGAINEVRAPRLAVLGTDCALGKRTTCHVVAAALRARGLAAEIVHTGQTGWLQGSRFGFVLDATPNDYVSGELEHAIVTCDREASPDVILLEGQSALRNPSGPCGAELLLSGGARGVILQHAPARRFFEDFEHLHLEIPSLSTEIELVGAYGARVLAIALNHEHIAEGERSAIGTRIAEETGLPTFYPLLDGLDGVIPAIERHVSEEWSR